MVTGSDTPNTSAVELDYQVMRAVLENDYKIVRAAKSQKAWRRKHAASSKWVLDLALQGI
jgi:hypothetical protein